jgi:hypothetical protein
MCVSATALVSMSRTGACDACVQRKLGPLLINPVTSGETAKSFRASRELGSCDLRHSVQQVNIRKKDQGNEAAHADRCGVEDGTACAYLIEVIVLNEYSFSQQESRQPRKLSSHYDSLLNRRPSLALPPAPDGLSHTQGLPSPFVVRPYN